MRFPELNGAGREFQLCPALQQTRLRAQPKVISLIKLSYWIQQLLARSNLKKLITRVKIEKPG
ncbi:MAG TPA: hypothetical protein DCM07_32345 [Planctomycetaceae bacterium]|nr:hypothetical protein [Gimesia sp.]HAH49448.1 hypothetical protein [Planctomycetaceae bacterium]HBL46423.1 hypothetical protein [Planctomycetaceae bacterium]